MERAKEHQLYKSLDNDQDEYLEVGTDAARGPAAMASGGFASEEPLSPIPGRRQILGNLSGGRHSGRFKCEAWLLSLWQ